jgi:UDP-N-acetylmuramate dehydrogenase
MDIKKHFSLKTYNTFGMEALADAFVEIQAIEDLQKLLEQGHFKGRFLILGGGSNILLTQNFEGLVIHVAIKGIEKLREQDNWVWIKVGAGENWDGLVHWAIANQLGGIENLALIPGTVGAAPMQNIGAYGREIAEVFDSLEAFEIATGLVKSFHVEDCAFGYRESVFKNSHKGKYIITSVTLRLDKKHQYKLEYGDVQTVIENELDGRIDIASIAEAVSRIRSRKLPDPKQIGNSGSFFKNPIISTAHFEQLKSQYPELPGYALDGLQVKVPAGWLIDRAGWKGYRQGDAGVHAKQALVLVNHGSAKGEEVWALAQKIQKDIEQKYGILLQPEVNVY